MRKIVIAGQPVLHKKAESVKKVDESIRKLIDEMTESMHVANGVGIAAPQVGESLQLAVVEVPSDSGEMKRIVLINPRIVSAYGSATAEEGCLSVPNVHLSIKRFKEIIVETQTIDGKTVTHKCDGLTARAVQHEIDHLNGILIIDKVSPIKRIFAKRKIDRKVQSI